MSCPSCNGDNHLIFRGNRISHFRYKQTDSAWNENKILALSYQSLVNFTVNRIRYTPDVNSVTTKKIIEKNIFDVMKLGEAEVWYVTIQCSYRGLDSGRAGQHG